MYFIDFTGKVEEYGTVELEAESVEEAEEFTRDHIREAYPEFVDVEINSIKEIVRK